MTQIIKKIINKKKVYIVEEHHHVLLPWASEREQLGIAPHVLTLDHHTDTLPDTLIMTRPTKHRMKSGSTAGIPARSKPH
ncbi:MAG: hypothetical protein V8T87_04585 [Victivallales bacterium]